MNFHNCSAGIMPLVHQHRMVGLYDLSIPGAAVYKIEFGG